MEYDAGWPGRFEAERALLERVLRAVVARVLAGAGIELRARAPEPKR